MKLSTEQIAILAFIIICAVLRLLTEDRIFTIMYSVGFCVLFVTLHIDGRLNTGKDQTIKALTDHAARLESENAILRAQLKATMPTLDRQTPDPDLPPHHRYTPLFHDKK